MAVGQASSSHHGHIARRPNHLKPGAGDQRLGIELIIFAQAHGLVVTQGVAIEEFPFHDRFQKAKLCARSGWVWNVSRQKSLKCQFLRRVALWQAHGAPITRLVVFVYLIEVVSKDIEWPFGEAEHSPEAISFHEVVAIQDADPWAAACGDSTISGIGRPFIGFQSNYDETTRSIIGPSSGLKGGTIVFGGVVDNNHFACFGLLEGACHGASDPFRRPESGYDNRDFG